VATGAGRAELATALFSLAFHSLDDPEPVRTAFDDTYGSWVLFSPEQALGVLANGLGTIPQAVILDAVARLGSAKGDELFADPHSKESQALDALIGNLGDAHPPDDVSVAVGWDYPAGAPGGPVRGPPPNQGTIDAVHNTLLQIVGLPPQKAAAVVLEQVGVQLGYKGADWTVPQCTDDRPLVRRRRCNRIHMAFHTSPR
jgi:hypothetical protein